MLLGHVVLLSSLFIAAPKTPQARVHVVLVNMSGKAREVHVGRVVVNLPVGERVPLNVPEGNAVAVTSATDSKVKQALMIQSRDEGAVIPVR